MTTVPLLVAPDVRDPEWAAPPRGVRGRFAIAQMACAASREFLAPTLRGVAAPGIVLIPMFVVHGGQRNREAPEMLDRLRSTWPEVRFSLGGAIGENEIVVQAMATVAPAVAGGMPARLAGDYTQPQTAEHPGVRYSTISRVTKKGQGR